LNEKTGASIEDKADRSRQHIDVVNR
jgi:hypothetical protein